MDHRVTGRDFLKKSAAAGVSLTTLPALLAACGGGGDTEGGGAKIPKSGKEISMKDFIAAAKEEGTLNTIALPPDWSNYGEIMETYQRKYSLRINNASPNAATAEGHEAAKALKGQSGRRTCSTSARRSPRRARPTGSTPSTGTPTGTRSPIS